jgi:hypothetical protein
MTTSTQLAKHLRDVFFGGNWTVSNVKEQLADVTWLQAITPVASLNTIATLAFHISYFVPVINKVLQGGPLEGSDKLTEDFGGTAKYGNYFRNIAGVVEHTHYHLGQIALIKKLLKEKDL